MIWKRKCARYRLLLALEAGRDLDEQSQSDVRRHIALCPTCRDYRGQVEAGRRLLEHAGRCGRTPDAGPSLWPALQGVLPMRRVAAPHERWAGWLPAVSLAAACLAVVYLVQTGPSFDDASRSLRPDLVQSVFAAPVGTPPQDAGPGFSDAVQSTPWEQSASMRPVPHWVSDGGAWNNPIERRRGILMHPGDPRSF